MRGWPVVMSIALVECLRRHRSPAADLQKQLDGRTRELAETQKQLAEALEQQPATSEILATVAHSSADVQSVLDAICQSAARLCQAYDSEIWRPDGDRLLLVAHYGPITQVESVPLERGTVTGRTVLDKRTLHIADLQTQADEFPLGSKLARRLTFRTMLSVSYERKSVVIGTIALRRTEAQLFTERQVALLKTFADQAVIAIENTRLLNELRHRTDELTESLQQQTATADVLQVISSSPGELEPVFQTMLTNATRICEAKFGVMFYYREGAFSPAAQLNVPKAFSEFIQQRGSYQPAAGSTFEHLIRTKQVIHLDDASRERQFFSNNAAKLGGARTYLAVPMLKEHELIGAFAIYRQEVRPFNDKQIALVQNFANQAVIAIENARLLNELRESLQQQTATSEVLRVISSSPGELEPVFEAVLANAVQVCGAQFGNLWLCEGNALRSGAFHGEVPAALIAQFRSGIR